MLSLGFQLQSKTARKSSVKPLKVCHSVGMTISFNFEQHLRSRLQQHTPDILSLDRPKAAVLVPLVSTPEPSILLTVRAAHLKSHPGQVSFPGGMAEASDETLAVTALRETHEEIAIRPQQVEVLGELSTAFSKDGVQVYPFVGWVDRDHQSEGSPDEIDEIFHVPWSFFANEAPELQKIERHGMSFEIPHFYFEGRHIWGLTAMILLELINLVEDKDWPVPQFGKATRPGETP